MIVEQWPIDRPIPYARNARKLSDRAVDTVAASLKEFGWRQPIVVDGDGVVVVGHTRLLAAKKLQLAEVPVHIATELTPAQITRLPTPFIALRGKTIKSNRPEFRF